MSNMDEKTLRDTADAMVENGFFELGYNYFNLVRSAWRAACWLAPGSPPAAPRRSSPGPPGSSATLPAPCALNAGTCARCAVSVCCRARPPVFHAPGAGGSNAPRAWATTPPSTFPPLAPHTTAHPPCDGSCAQDDCWAKGRHANGSLFADPAHFPSATLKPLADYVHAKVSRGLQLQGAHPRARKAPWPLMARQPRGRVRERAGQGVTGLLGVAARRRRCGASAKLAKVGARLSVPPAAPFARPRSWARCTHSRCCVVRCTWWAGHEIRDL